MGRDLGSMKILARQTERGIREEAITVQSTPTTHETEMINMAIRPRVAARVTYAGTMASIVVPASRKETHRRRSRLRWWPGQVLRMPCRKPRRWPARCRSRGRVDGSPWFKKGSAGTIRRGGAGDDHLDCDAPFIRQGRWQVDRLGQLSSDKRRASTVERRDQWNCIRQRRAMSRGVNIDNYSCTGVHSISVYENKSRTTSRPKPHVRASTATASTRRYEKVWQRGRRTRWSARRGSRSSQEHDRRRYLHISIQPSSPNVFSPE